MSANDGPLVVFKSIPDFYTIERNGNKPNTVRLMSDHEYSERLDFARACLMAGEPATVRIINAADTTLGFFRRITSIDQIGAMLGQTMWVISWRHEDGDGTYCEEDGDE